MKASILSLVVMIVTFGQGASAENLADCVVKISNAGMYGYRASQYCQRNSSDEFVSCTVRLAEGTSMYAGKSADYCLVNSSEAFVNCTLRLVRDANMYGYRAADTCLSQ